MAATKAIQCVDRLKSKYPEWQTYPELASFALNRDEQANDELVKRFQYCLKHNSKINYDPSRHRYRFKPPYDVSDPEQLLAWFQKQETTTGVDVRKLKEGWAECEPAIDQLEKEHKVIVLRNKKDLHPRTVWADDPDLFAPMDQEFKDMWSAVQIPTNKDDVSRQLEAEGFSHASILNKNLPVAAKAKTIKKTRRGNKVTNTHMNGMLRDYSNMRPVGK